MFNCIDIYVDWISNFDSDESRTQQGGWYFTRYTLDGMRYI